MEAVIVDNEIDWGELQFEYIDTHASFSARYKEGQWETGALTEDSYVSVHEGSTGVHYAQQCFEGMKAFTARDGRVLLFRPDMNWERMRRTCERLMIPPVPRELFFDGIIQCIQRNADFVPPYGSGASLYIRPFVIGVGRNLGLRPAPEFLFRVFVSPVGPYFKGNEQAPITLAVVDFDRSATRGTGHVKAGANYAGALLASATAREQGADEALFLDSRQNRYIDEAGSSNILIVTDEALLVPTSPAVLPGITRMSAIEVAREELALNVVERPVGLRDEMHTFVEVAAAGTAATLIPVGAIQVDGETHTFYNGGATAGPVTEQLYKILTAIQTGDREDKFGWIHTVEIA